MPKMIQMSEVAKHNKESDCWLVINGKVYDVTEFIEEHPGTAYLASPHLNMDCVTVNAGGEGVLIAYAGTDCTEQFESVIHSQAAAEIMKELYQGDLAAQSKL